MPRKDPKLTVASRRTAEARRAVNDQHTLIARLTVAGEPTLEAVQILQTYLSILWHLEAHEEKLRKERRAKKTETKKTEILTEALPGFSVVSQTLWRATSIGSSFRSVRVASAEGAHYAPA